MVQPAPLVYKLSYEEGIIVGHIGEMRRNQGIHLGRSKPIGDPEDEWRTEVESCGSEYVVAKYYGLVWHCWAEKPHLLPGDVGRIQVRHTQYGGGHLIVYEERDRVDAPYVLVTGKFPTFTIRGWAFGQECKQAEYWRTDVREASYWVPQSRLHHPDTLDVTDMLPRHHRHPQTALAR